jgi:hypothetical protein
MHIFGVTAFQLVVADHGLFIHPGQPSGGSYPTALLDMLEHRHDFLLVQVGVEQRGAFALRKAGLAGATIQQTQVLFLSIAGTHGQISEAPLAVVRTVFILAAESGKVIHRCPPEG